VLNCSEELSVKSGESVSLSAIGSTDPDGDHISFLWFSYPEAGSYEEPIVKVVENLYKFWFVAPKVKQKETAHIILKVTDKGSPQLSRYKRVIVNILP
jgi:hypothetical protein